MNVSLGRLRRMQNAECRMQKRAFALVALLVLLAYGCATTAPQPKGGEVLHGTASWYGEEFAGRTTANGEIFDPLQLTAAHRTLPFGTVIDVRNSKTGDTVRVRINDRGPWIGDRMLDLSYAAAQKIALIEPGTGPVDITIVSLGRGDREPPAPYDVTISGAKPAVVPSAAEPPKVDFPLPAQVTLKPSPSTATDPDADFGVKVEEQRQGIATRRQVSADGRRIEDVPVEGEAAAAQTDVPAAPGHAPAATLDRKPASARPVARGAARYVIQVGAFSLEANARSLQERLARIGQKSHVDHDELFRVRIGPFDTREDAVRVRSSLEANGISAIVLTE